MEPRKEDNMRQKLVTMILAAALVLGMLTACTPGGEEEDEEEEGSRAPRVAAVLMNR